MRYRGLFIQIMKRFGWLVFLPMAAIFMGLSSCNLRELNRNRAIRILQEQAKSAAVEVMENPKTAGLTAGPDYNRICRELARENEARIILMTTDGNVLGDSRYGSYELSEPKSRKEVAFAMDGETNTAIDEDRTTQRDFIRAAVPIRGDGRVIGVLSMIQPWHGVAGMMNQIAANSILPLICLLALIGAAAHGVSANIGGLVRDLSVKTTTIGGGTGEDEVHTDEDPFLQLTADLNALDRRVDQQISELTRQKRQWESLFTNMREGFLAVDGNMQIITINRSARRVFGLDNTAGVGGRPLAATIRNADLNTFINTLLDGGPPFREEEIEVRLEGGRRCQLRLSGVRFRENEQGVLVVLHDITQIKRLEQMRRDFVANVSHELKTPLTAIKGFLEPLEDCLDADAEQARNFVAVITRHATRMNAIIDDLLMLSKLEQLDLQGDDDIESRDLAECIRQAIVLCRPKSEELQVDVDPELCEAVVAGNHRLLEQAMVNLLDNAVKYSPSGSTVKISMTIVDDRVQVAVTDQGIGISPEHLARVFERFYRVDKSRDRKTGGTGLGLSIVKHIAMLHGGTVTVESERDKGSTFTMSIPLATAQD